MNKIKVVLKKFFKNKNTVTILCVVLGLVILYFGYSYRIKQATNPISIPYAKVEIQPRTLITEDMVGLMDVPKTMINSATIRSVKDIVGKYANYNTMIPQGSVFYNSTVVSWSEMPDSAFADIPDGYTVVSLSVNTETTYGNSIFPGNYIDLYYAATDSTGKLLLGKLIESIEVLAVKDANGKHVFENSSNLTAPSALIFAVPEKLHLLLRKASYLSGQIIPVPRNASYTAEAGSTVVSSEYIENFILSQTVVIPDEQLPVIESSTTTTE